jgi:hypothetical protein
MWFKYLFKNSTRTVHRPKISFLPTKRSKYTFTKAPMAHKTFSQEQFIFKFYKFKICFKIKVLKSNLIIGLNNSIYLLLFLRNCLPVLETNIFFLKKFSFKLFSSDTKFLLHNF